MSTMKKHLPWRLGPHIITKMWPQLVWAGNNKHITFRDDGALLARLVPDYRLSRAACESRRPFSCFPFAFGDCMVDDSLTTVLVRVVVVHSNPLATAAILRAVSIKSFMS
jgi:hypothetical protein